MRTLERLAGPLTGRGGARRALAVAAAVASAAALLLFVDLSPQVGSDFFFASDDPQLREDREIERLFPERPQLLVSAAATDIASPGYLARIADLSRELGEVEGVLNVRSVHQGPEDVEDAFENPLWRRLLVSEDGRATNLVLLLGAGAGAARLPSARPLDGRRGRAGDRGAKGVSYRATANSRSRNSALRR